MIDNRPNIVINPDDPIRRQHLNNLLHELGNPDAVWVDGTTPVVDYYMASAQDPNSMINSLPYGDVAENINDMKYGDVMKAQIVGRDFLTTEREHLAITVGFRVIALLREPDVQSGMFTNLDSWIDYWRG